MKPKRTAIVISLIVHLCITLGLFYLRIGGPEQGDLKWTNAIFLTEQEKPPRPPIVESRPLHPSPPQPKTEQIEKIVSEAPTDPMPVIPDTVLGRESLVDILTWNTDSLRLQMVRRLLLYNTPIPALLLAPSDSALLMYRLALYGKPMEDYYSGYGADRIGAQLYKENLGHSPLFDIEGFAKVAFSAFSQKPEPKQQKRPRIISEPTKLELDVLTMLWTQGEQNQMDLYRKLDKDLPTTASDFDIALEKMTEKGFLARQKTSPEDLLHILTPVGTTSIEKNELNRKNPVYQYSSVITREEVLRYLDALLYQLRERTAEQEILAQADTFHIKSLEEKIIKILETSGPLKNSLF